MKIMKWGLILILFLGLGACVNTNKEPKDVPDLTDEKIRTDAQIFTSYVTNYESIETLTYTIDKLSSTRWTINGQLSLKTSRCTINGPFTMVYSYKDAQWSLGANSYQPSTLVDITEEPDEKEAQNKVYQSIIGQDGTITYPLDAILLEDSAVIMNIGQASYTYSYELIEGPTTIKKTVDVNAIFSYQNGWTFALGNSTFENTIQWTYNFYFVWDVLESETKFSNGEITEVHLQGLSSFSGGEGLNTKLISNSLTAIVLIKDEQIIVNPSIVNDEFGINMYQLRFDYGPGEKDYFILVYGESEYKGVQMWTHYYLVSADLSQAK